MALIEVSQPNGKRWCVTHCETIIPTGGAEGMTPVALAKAVVDCEHLSRRLAAHLSRTGSVQDCFRSVGEFERHERNPSVARALARAGSVSRRRARSGVVYLVKGDESYKIGRSTRFAARAHFLSTKLPFEVQVVHVIQASDSVAVERYWHERFAALRTRGEWFALEEDDVVAFKRCSSM
jgi:hypothetical protein